ncbi:hypothetical protein NFJ02_01g39820 [Pycnococcus provasolii]
MAECYRVSTAERPPPVVPPPGPRDSVHDFTLVDGTGDRDTLRPMLGFRPERDTPGYGVKRLLLDEHMMTGRRVDIQLVIKGVLSVLLRDLPKDPLMYAVNWLKSHSLTEAVEETLTFHFPKNHEDWRRRQTYNAYLHQHNLQVVFQEMLQEVFEFKPFSPLEFAIDFISRKIDEAKEAELDKKLNYK